MFNFSHGNEEERIVNKILKEKNRLSTTLT